MSVKKGGAGAEGDDGKQGEEGQGQEDSGSAFGVPMWTDAGSGDEVTAEAEKRVGALMVHDFSKKRHANEALAEALGIEDIVERAKFLKKHELVDFKDFKEGRINGTSYVQILNTDHNRMAALDALFGGGDVNEVGLGLPHLNTFQGRLVDWLGRLVDDRYPIRSVFEAMTVTGVKGMSTQQVRGTLKDWAMERQVNDLIVRMERMIPEWDGVERLDDSLITLFKCRDTALTRDFSRYFWLSLYCRIMHPGCFAPMVLSLFGRQLTGKSYFAKMICQEVIGNKDADSVLLDLAGDKVDFLRDITGVSVVANIGEMTGFTRGDLNKIKDFITRTSDRMHYKFEGQFTQPRQWVAVMDGNKYEGLQRDDTGNRRFYPVFVGQLEDDDNGQPQWIMDPEWKLDFSGFRSDFWMYMAEAAVWVNAHGLAAYEKFVDSVVKGVQEFNRAEMAADRGTIRDDDLTDYLDKALRCVEVTVWEPNEGEKSRPRKNLGVWISNASLNDAFKLASRSNNMRVNHQHLKNKLARLGAETMVVNSIRGYLWRDVMSYEEWARRVGIDDDGAKVVRAAVNPSRDGGGF
ncbi:hypothetical protein PLUTO_00610 [Luteibacter phage vB_LflM-Pluto]|uniref:Virulence-associated protein E-like domain-containing protein n=1 Tax=Luteibacter phage vB_LflM-Pluto TaxID=2948611 RepID=A0A9E7SN61_9CAUD|nr:hypothetical protein PLUTO_00610 [Luteibacter phage vB_LflM-Pluto]